MPSYEELSPDAQHAIEKLCKAKGISRDEAINEVVIEAIAMGGLAKAGRPKASVSLINGPPRELGQTRD